MLITPGMSPMWRDLVEGSTYVDKCVEVKIGINIDEQTYCGTLKKIPVFLKNIFASFFQTLYLKVWLSPFISSLSLSLLTDLFIHRYTIFNVAIFMPICPEIKITKIAFQKWVYSCWKHILWTRILALPKILPLRCRIEVFLFNFIRSKITNNDWTKRGKDLLVCITPHNCFSVFHF